MTWLAAITGPPDTGSEKAATGRAPDGFVVCFVSQSRMPVTGFVHERLMAAHSSW
jgi:hypothetical protein